MLFESANEVNRSRSSVLSGLLKSLGGCLGLLQQAPKAFLQSGAELDASAIQMLIDERTAAKAGRDFARADTIRKDLLSQGIVLKDSPAGTHWEVVQ